jgi:hypothetical protein
MENLIAPPPPPPAQIIIGTDSETGKIQPGLLAPPLCCVSTAVRVGDRIETQLYGWQDGLAFYKRALTSGALLVIHNAPFDLLDCIGEQQRLHPVFTMAGEDPGLLGLVFDAFERGNICCTVTLQKLIDVALGQRKFRRAQGLDGVVRVTKSTYYLADLIKLYYGEEVSKKDTWRTSYQLLRDIPVEQWPPAARRYAIDDAVLHLRLREAQMRLIADKWGELPNQIEQQRAAWVLNLMSQWGMRADQGAVDVFIGHCQEQIDKMRDALKETAILKADGSRLMSEIRRRVVESLTRRGAQVPMTPPSPKFPNGQVRTDEDTLRLTDDPKLHVLADTLTFQKHMGQWGPVVQAAVHRPVCCRYNVLVDNGRTSCSGGEGQEGTNIQNPPRKGDVRPCFIPRPGWLYCSTDADTVEMRANAQNALEMVGWSRMADALWEQHEHNGPDLHVCLAANVAAISKAEAHELHTSGDAAFKNVRQMSKHGNFAFLGGAGGKRFAGMAHGFGLALSQTFDHSYQLVDACPVFMEEEYAVDEAGLVKKKRIVTKWVSFEAEVNRALLIKNMFLETWPEERVIFRMIKQHLDRTNVAQQLMSRRIRGDCDFTSLSNSFFSGRVADCMKEILWKLAIECYLGRCTSKHIHGQSNLCTYSGRSVIYGSRPVAFLHDEPIVEHPEDGSESDRADRQQQIMLEGLHVWMPGVPTTSSAVLSRRWQKGAEPLRVNDKLVPVRPEKIDGKVKWVQDFGDLAVAA